MSDKKVRDNLELEIISQKQPLSNSKSDYMAQVITISKIAATVGVTPNQLVAAYTLPDGDGKCDLVTMQQDLKKENGARQIQEKIKSFEQEHEVKRPEFLDRILNQKDGHEASGEKSHVNTGNIGSR